MLNARRARRAYLFSLCFLFFYLFLLSRGGGEEYMHKLNHPVRYGERRLDYHYDNQYLGVIPFKLRPAREEQFVDHYGRHYERRYAYCQHDRAKHGAVHVERSAKSENHYESREGQRNHSHCKVVVLEFVGVDNVRQIHRHNAYYHNYRARHRPAHNVRNKLTLHSVFVRL